MGFPARHENGELIDIVEKSHDGNGNEVFTDSAGKRYTRALASGGNDAHTLVDYDPASGIYVENNDADLVEFAVGGDSTGPSQAEVDSVSKDTATEALATVPDSTVTDGTVTEPTVEDAGQGETNGGPLADAATETTENDGDADDAPAAA